MAEAAGFEPASGISPVRLPQTPYLFGYMLPLLGITNFLYLIIYAEAN